MSKKKNKKNSKSRNVQYVNRNNNKNVKKQVAISEQEQRHRAAAANRAKASSRQSEEKTKVFKAVKPEDFVKISQSAPPPKPQKKKKRHYSATAPKAQTVQQKKSGKKRIWIFVILLIAVVAVLSSVEFISAKKGSNANNNRTAEETYKRLRDETAAPQTESKTETETQTKAPTVTTETTTTTTNFLDTVDLNAELDPVKQLDVDVVMQKPELPTGCEVTSLTMVLNYWGYNISKTDLADNFLPQTEDYYGKIDFNDYFGGSPYNDNDFGCFAPVIQKTAENYFKTVPNPMEAANVSGQSLDDLCHYIDLGYPVVVWATIGCYEADWKHYWTLDNGEEVDFPSLEHCVVLTGYDRNNNLVYINDPLKGAVSYDKDTFENVYDEMRQMAVLVYK